MKQADVEKAVDKILKESIEDTKKASKTPRNKAEVTLETGEKDDEMKSLKGSNELSEEETDLKGKQTVITKFDAEDESTVTFLTDATSALTSHPLSISNALTSSSKLEL